MCTHCATLETPTRPAAAVGVFAAVCVLLVLRYAPLRLSVFPEVADARTELFLTRVSDLILATGTTCVLLRVQRQPIATIGLRATGLPAQIGWGIAGVAIWVSMVCAAAAGYYMYAEFTGSRIPGGGRTAVAATVLTFEDSLAVGVLMGAAAATEEILLRGLMLPRLHRLSGNWVASGVLVSLLSASLHFDGSVLYAAQAAMVSACVCTVFVFSRSLIAAMLMHAGGNFMQFLLLNIWFRL